MSSARPATAIVRAPAVSALKVHVRPACASAAETRHTPFGERLALRRLTKRKGAPASAWGQDRRR